MEAMTACNSMYRLSCSANCCGDGVDACGSCRWIPDLLAFLLSPWNGQLVLAISSVSEAAEAVSVWPSGEVSAC